MSWNRNKSPDFRCAEAAIFTLNWQEYRDRLEKSPDTLAITEVWRLYGTTLYNCWKGLMKILLPSYAYHILDAHCYVLDMRKTIWMQPGGYLFTKAGTRRKRTIRFTNRPVEYEQLVNKLDLAYDAIFDLLPDRTHNDVQTIILALSGTITTHDVMHDVPKHKKLKFVEDDDLHFFPWKRSVRNRLKWARRFGILSKPDDRMVKRIV